MRHRALAIATVSFAALTSFASESFAQTLAGRIASSSARSVQFSYQARPGVCGDGRTYISTRDTYGGTYTVGNPSEQCQAGPVRVELDLADRSVISLRTYVGGTQSGSEVVNLGTVTPAEAADYFITVAARADGRVGRDAIFAALLGDNVDVSSRLLEIARDNGRPLETRSAAVSGLARTGKDLDRIAAGLVQIARNEDDAQRIRSHALAALARLEQGAGVPPLIQLASGNNTSWIGRESMSVLARSGDPRARQFLRTIVQRNDLPDELLAAALRGLGGSYVTGQDAALLRSLYPRLTGTASQNAVLSAIASLGGTENVQWLMGVVRDERYTPEMRRRALESARRAGAPTASLIALYDATQDTQIRASLIEAYRREANKTATDKLVWIARNEENMTLRRRAISALSRNADPEVRQALQAIVER